MGPSIRPRCDFFHLPQSVSSLQGWSPGPPGLRGGAVTALTTDRVPCALVPTWGLHRAFHHPSDNGAWGSSLARDTGGQCLAVQRVPPLRAWSSVPPTVEKRRPVGSRALGLETLGSSLSPESHYFLGGRMERKAETVWEQRRAFARMFPGVSPSLVRVPELWPGSPFLPDSPPLNPLFPLPERSPTGPAQDSLLEVVQGAPCSPVSPSPSGWLSPVVRGRGAQ